MATPHIASSAVGLPDRRAALAGAGVVLGAIVGIVLGFVMAGNRLFLPVLLALGCALVGAGAGALEAERRRRRPVPPPPPPPAPPSAPTHLRPPPDAPDIPTWLTDPEDPDRLRLWDGSAWTAHVWARKRRRPTD